ncbi:Cleavage and polyadenylation specificity factor subunit 1 [Thelohanellus kitauei]|uniref:Cleavage and polyadenylation specificity factor subunit 1 n=1 Tax=Thelohanellus kitauei TaxID=669202 RepID=A0A0C2NHL4_THEKT|nr:Cleavage and polyadenylation specificity factor subunit 1 [Thelohanellus kitauei]
MYYYRELLPSTAVDFATVSDFIARDSQNFILVKSNLLEVCEIVIDDLNKERLVIFETYEFYSKILCIISLKPSEGSDILLLCFPSFKVSVVRFNIETRKLDILQIFDFEHQYILPHAIPTSLSENALFRTNMSQNTAALIENNQIILFYMRESGDSELSFVARHLEMAKTGQKMGRLIDLEFLHTYGNDTVGLLYEPLTTDMNLLSVRADTCSFSAYVIDEQMVNLIHVWSKHNLPFDSFKIIPVCENIGGVAIFGDHQVVYISQVSHPYSLGSSYTPPVSYIPHNQVAPKDMSFHDSVVAVVSNNQILVSAESGELYVLDFIHSNRKLERIHMCPLNYNHLTSCICTYKDLVFLGSRTQNSLLVCLNSNVTQNEWSFDVIDEFFNVGSPVSACLGKSSCKKYLDVCLLCESNKSSKIHVLKKNIPFTEINSLNIPTAQKVVLVSINEDFKRFSYLVISLQASSMILQNGEELTEIENSNFIDTESTLDAISLSTYEILQVTPTKMRLFNTVKILDELCFGYRALNVSRAKRNIYITDETSNLHSYKIENNQIIFVSTRANILTFTTLNILEDEYYLKPMLSIVTDGGIFEAVVSGVDETMGFGNFFHLPNTFIAKPGGSEQIFNSENLLGIREIYFANLGQTSIKPFLFVRCSNFIVAYKTEIKNGILTFRRVNKFINLSNDETLGTLFSYITMFKKSPAVFICSRIPRLVISTNDETLSVFTIDIGVPFRDLTIFDVGMIDHAYVCLDDECNVKFLQLTHCGSFHRGWVHKVYPIDFVPGLIDFHPKYNVYFISGHNGLGPTFTDSYIYSFNSSDSYKKIKTLENQEISYLKLLNLNYMDSRAVFLVVSTIFNKDDAIIGKLNIFDVVCESGFSLVHLTALEFDGGIMTFDCLDGKIAVSSMEKIYVVEYDKETRIFVNVCYLNSSYAALSLKSLKNFIAFGDLVTGINLLHYQKAFNQMSLLGRKRVNKYPICTDFIVNDTKIDVISSFADCSLITLGYNPEISKTKNGTELLMTSGSRLPSRVVNMLKILDKKKVFEHYITLMILVQNSGGVGVIVPIPEKLFRRHILMKSRLNNDLPDECALNFSRERGDFCDFYHKDTNTKQILDEILFNKFLSMELMTCYDVIKRYGITFSQMIEDIFLFDRLIAGNFYVAQ